MKKKLLIVGNKPLKNDIQDYVNSFDFIVRYNKLENSDKTGTRCDLYCATYGIDHFLQNISEEKLDIIKSYDNFMTYSYNHLKAIGKDDCENIDIINWDELGSIHGNLVKHDGSFKFQSIVNIIMYCILKFSNEYDIYALGFDMDRTYLNNPIHKYHTDWKEEHILLCKLILQNKFKYIVTE